MDKTQTEDSFSCTLGIVVLLNKRVFEEVFAENVDKTGIYAIV